MNFNEILRFLKKGQKTTETHARAPQVDGGLFLRVPIYQFLNSNSNFKTTLNLSLTESVMETCSVVLTVESVNEILWCDHSNETSSAVLFHGTISFSIFYKMKFGIFLEFCSLAPLGVNELNL